MAITIRGNYTDDVDVAKGSEVEVDFNNVASNFNTHEINTTTHGVGGNIVGTTDSQTLTNKTISSPTITTPDVTTPTISTSIILEQTAGDYTLTWANPAAARALSWDDPGGDDKFVFAAATQTLTNKTLTAPDINGGTWNGTIDGSWTAAGVTCSDLGTVSASTLNAPVIVAGIQNFAVNYEEVTTDTTLLAVTVQATVTTLAADITIGLRSSEVAVEGREVTVTDGTGTAGVSYTITIDGQSGETINGVSSVIIDEPYGSFTFRSDGTNWILV